MYISSGQYSTVRGESEAVDQFTSRPGDPCECCPRHASEKQQELDCRQRTTHLNMKYIMKRLFQVRSSPATYIRKARRPVRYAHPPSHPAYVPRKSAKGNAGARRTRRRGRREKRRTSRSHWRGWRHWRRHRISPSEFAEIRSKPGGPSSSFRRMSLRMLHKLV